MPLSVLPGRQLFNHNHVNLGTGKVNFDGFCRIASHFLEEEDAEAMQEELKEAFRLYDREGNQSLKQHFNEPKH